MNFFKFICELATIVLRAITLVILLIVLYWFTIDAAWTDNFVSLPTVILMWASAFFGLLAGKFE